MKRLLSLGVLLQAITGLMAAALIATCALSASHAYHRREVAREVLASSDISRDLFDAMRGLRLERGAAAVVLGSHAPTSDAYERIPGVVGPSEAALDRAFGALDGRAASDAVLQVRLKAARSLYSRLRHLRPAVVAAVADPSLRTPALRARWVDTADALLAALDSLADRLAERSESDAFVARMVRIKGEVWRARQAFGGEIMLLGDLGGQDGPPSDAQREAFAASQGRTLGVWETLAHDAEASDAPAELRQAFAEADIQLLQIARRQEAAALAALSATPRGQLSGKTLNDSFLRVADSMAAVADTAFDLMTRHARAEVAAAQRDFELAMELMAGACLMGLIGAVVIFGRVVKPLREITEATSAVADGDLQLSAPYAERQDEIGRLARALGVFRRTALEARRIEAELTRSEMEKATAEAANQMKSQFLANMSHEIRTPLNGVLGMAQVMEMGALSPVQRERLGVIRESGGALLQVLNDVLDISKIEAGRLELKYAPFDLETLVRRTTATFADQAAAKGLTLSGWVTDRARGSWIGDAERLRQILQNLISNAVKFTDAGEVVLTVERASDGLVFQVRDTGIGMAADDVPRLFEKFSQVDESNERRFGGTGLGLAICRELAGMMGGRIGVESEPGRGSIFRVAIPAVRAEAAPPAAPESEAVPAPAPTTAARVLAAEDNPTNQRVLQALMEPLGVELTIVGDGREAVEAWRTGAFDLILMDIQMPGMGGVAATREIRREEAAAGRPPAPIIALSANAMSHQVAEYLAAGMTGYVAKPIQIATLHEAVRAALEPSPAQPRRAAG